MLPQDKVVKTYYNLRAIQQDAQPNEPQDQPGTVDLAAEPSDASAMEQGRFTCKYECTYAQKSFVRYHECRFPTLNGGGIPFTSTAQTPYHLTIYLYSSKTTHLYQRNGLTTPLVTTIHVPTNNLFVGNLVFSDNDIATKALVGMSAQKVLPPPVLQVGAESMDVDSTVYEF